MTKCIAMIPMLLGSTRIPDKNTLLVNGYPFVHYVVEACKKSGVFDEIHINSEHEELRGMIENLGVKFYLRDAKHGGSACEMQSKSRICQKDRCQVHDHYLIDFMENIKSEYLVQIHTTSPLIKPATVKQFADTLIKKKHNSLFAVEERFAESFYEGKPINFKKNIKTMTQGLSPLQVISWALSGWKVKSFKDSYYSNDPEKDGPTYVGNVGLFPVNKIEALDADDMDDLFIVEACLNHQKRKGNLAKHRYTDRIKTIDNDLEKTPDFLQASTT